MAAAQAASILAQDDAAATAGALSARQLRFVEEYPIDRNGAAAARRAGFSKASARVIACQLLQRPAIQAAIKARMVALSDHCNLTAEAVLLELEAIAYASLANVLEIVTERIAPESGTPPAAGTPAPRARPIVRQRLVLKRGAEIPPEAWAAIAEISETNDGRLRVKLHNKLDALDKLGQFRKLWEGRGASAVSLTVRLVREDAPAHLRKVG